MDKRMRALPSRYESGRARLNILLTQEEHARIVKALKHLEDSGKKVSQSRFAREVLLAEVEKIEEKYGK